MTSNKGSSQAPHTLLPSITEIFTLEPFGVFLPSKNTAPEKENLSFAECEQIEKLLLGTVPFECQKMLSRRPSLGGTTNSSSSPPASAATSSPPPPFRPLSVLHDGSADVSEPSPLQPYALTNSSLFHFHDSGPFVPAAVVPPSIQRDVDIAYEGAYGGAAARAIVAREKGRLTDRLMQRDLLQRRPTKYATEDETKKNK